MTDDQRQEIMRLQYERMQNMSKEELALRQFKQEAARKAWCANADYARGQADMSNFWHNVADAPPKPRQTLWARLKRWILA